MVKKNTLIDCFCVFQGTSACIGDSGGGFVINKQKTWFIRGIVSLGLVKRIKSEWGEEVITTCNESYPSLYTDLASYIEWIAQNVPEIRRNVVTQNYRG
jgi:secreted trypsin-like serine protease